MSYLNNLAITTVNGAAASATANLINTIQSKLANGGMDTKCRFYYNNGAGGSVLRVMVRGVVRGIVSELKDDAVNAFNSLLDKKPSQKAWGEDWIKPGLEAYEKEWKKYGMMEVAGGTVYALDDFGNRCVDALMLSIELDPGQQWSVSQTWQTYKAVRLQDGTYKDATEENRNNLTTTELVWYDTTALVTVNSDKNIVTTKVAGRDYSRKELVSNGDVKFSVSGQITSTRPDVYPSDEIAKFLKVMRYKGVVRVNNQILDHLGVTHIVIENFNLSPKQGYKSVQQYSFSAIGLQPESERAIKNDTVKFAKEAAVPETKNDGNEWKNILDNQLKGLRSMAPDLFSQGAALASGMLDNAI